MKRQGQDPLSEEIKVRIEGGVVTIDHSDAYQRQQERFFAGEKFSRSEMLANQKLIEAEEAQMEAARRDPAGFLRDQQARLHPELARTLDEPSAVQSDIKPPAGSPAGAATATDHQGERLSQAKQAFEEASEADKAIAIKNLEGIQKKLQEAPYMTPEFLLQAQQKAFVDEGMKLHELNLAANRKDNALTWEVANFSQAPGKTMLNADAGVGVDTGVATYGANLHHGFDAKALGLTLAEGHAGMATSSEGAVGAEVGLRAVKQVYGDKERNVFLAAGMSANIAGIETSNPSASGTATALAVHAHTLMDQPVSEIAGAVMDVETGKATLVGSVSTTLNADSRHATTLRGVGTYGVESGSGGFSLEAYQQTGVRGLTARLAAGVNDVGEANDVTVNAGLSYGF